MRKNISLFKNQKLAGTYILILLFLAIFGDFLANDKPLFCSIDGRLYSPIVKSYLVDLELSRWNDDLPGYNWEQLNYDFKVMPLIPYNYSTIDPGNANFKSPFESQEIDNWRKRHWLGTDQIGRDVLAGMIHGARISCIIGFLSMLVAAFAGIPLGAISGYYGDKRIQVSAVSVVLFLSFLSFAYLYVLYSHDYLGVHVRPYLKLLFLLLIIALSALILKILTRKVHFRLKIPIDSFILRLAEIFRSVPLLIILMALVAIYQKISTAGIAILIGVLQWPAFALFVRSEMLKVRQEDYIAAAEVIGTKSYRILWKHALPNAIGPVWIIFAFGVASSILIESTLSFLGIGLSVDEVTWGSLLNEARKYFQAWWLAFFPGLAIFLTVFIFNQLGDRLNEANNPKKFKWI